jgi:nucleoside-diphosphate-sugar epimerase
MTGSASNRPPLLLVTGAAGHLGAEIVRRATAEGFYCRALDLRMPAILQGSESFPTDILAPEELALPMSGVDAVIHSAAVTPYSIPCPDLRRYREINVVGTENVVRTAVTARIPHVVLVSSVAVYGGSSRGVIDERTACQPVDAYGRSKLDAERAAVELVCGTGTALTVLRLATLYGGGPGNVRRLARRISRGRFFWVGDGSNRKSLLHFEDAARACLLAAGRKPCETAFFNVSAPPATMKEIVNFLAGALGVTVPGWGVPAGVARAARGLLGRVSLPSGRRLPGYRLLDRWLADDVYDATRFTAEFEFQSSVTLEEGLTREAHALAGR